MNMQKLMVIITLTLLIIVPTISAQLIFEKDSNPNLKIPCIINGSICSPSSECWLTYIAPNTTTLVDNQSMTNAGPYHNYTVDASRLGIYTATVSCFDNGWWGTNTFEILVTPNGEQPDTAKSIVDLAMLFFLIVLLVFSILGIFTINNVNAKFALYWVSHLLAIGVTFIAWQTSSGVLSYSPFVGEFFRIAFFVLLVAFLPMFLLSIFFIIKFHFINKNVMDLINAGYEREDAERIALRSAKEL